MVIGTATTGSYNYVGVDGYTVLTDYFDRYDLGTTYDWTNEWGGSLPDIENKDENLGGTTLRYNEISSSERFLSFDGVTAAATVELVVAFQFTSIVGGLHRIYVRGGGTSGSKNGYAYFADANNHGFFKFVSNTFSFINITSRSHSNNVRYVVRIRADGTALKARQWVEGEAEPGTWQVDITDSDLANGKVGIGMFQQSGDYGFDYFSVGIDVPEGTVPLPMDAVPQRLWRNFSEVNAEAEWCPTTSIANETLSVVDDGAATGGKVLRINRSVSTSGESTYVWGASSHGEDQDVYLRFRQDSVSNGAKPRIWIHSRLDNGNNRGFYIELLDDGSFDAYDQNNGGIPTQIDTATFARTANTWYKMRLTAAKGTVIARIWGDSSVEPSTVNIQTNDTSFLGGSIGLSMDFATTGTIQFDVDVISCGNFNNVGTELPESEMPAKGLLLANSADDSYRLIADDGTNHVMIGRLHSSGVRSAAYDQTNENIYIGTLDDDAVYKADRYGKLAKIESDSKLIIKDGVYGIAVDPSGDKIFYISDTLGDVFSATLSDGSSESEIKSSANSNNRGVFWEPTSSKVFYSSGGSHRRMDADGTNDEEMIAQTSASSIVSDNTYFWFVRESDTDVKRRDIDKTNEITLYSTLTNPQGLAIDPGGQKIFVSDTSSNLIKKSDYDGSNETNILTGIAGFRHMAFFNLITESTASTASHSYLGVDGSAVLGAISATATTPSFQYLGVDASEGVIRTASTPSYTYTALIATSNHSTATTASHEYLGLSGVGVLTQTSITVEFPVSEKEYTEFGVDILTSDITSHNVTSFDTTLFFDVNDVSFVHVNPKGITLGKSLTVNNPFPGTIEVSYTGTQITGTGVLFEIVFLAGDVVGSISSSLLQFVSFQYNSGTPTNITTDGNIDIVENLAVTASYSYIGVTSGNVNLGVTPVYTYNGIDGHPVLPPGNNTGFGIPPAFNYAGLDASSTVTNISQLATTPSYIYTPIDGLSNVVPITGTATTPSYTYTPITPASNPNAIATTPSYSYIAVTPTELAFGTPRNVKLESYNNFSVKLTIQPKVFDGVLDEDETLIIKAVVKDNEFKLKTITQQLFLLILKPDRTVEGWIEIDPVSEGHYEYEYVATTPGTYWVRIQDPLSDLIEEKRFRVRKSGVRS